MNSYFQQIKSDVDSFQGYVQKLSGKWKYSICINIVA